MMKNLILTFSILFSFGAIAQEQNKDNLLKDCVKFEAPVKKAAIRHLQPTKKPVRISAKPTKRINRMESSQIIRGWEPHHRATPTRSK